MIFKILGWGALVVFVIFLGLSLVALDEENTALPSTTRASKVEINGSTVYLWTFEFEGKQCLWVTSSRHSGRGGLTCDWGQL